MKVLYTYRRNFAPYTEEEDDLNSALTRAVIDIEYNKAYPEKIEAADGSFCYERGDRWDGELDKLIKQRKAELEATGGI